VQAVKFNQLIQQPFSIDRENLVELEQLIKDFPYFQSAHMLLNLASKRWDASIYQQGLKKTAIVVSNRTHLFKLHHLQEKALISLNTRTTKQEITKQESPLVTDELPNVMSKEDIQEELNILKATDVAHEQNEAIVQPQEVVKLEPALLEEEIAKQVVAAIVDKEIINPIKVSDQDVENEAIEQIKPASFCDWLSFMKKNNGQNYHDIEKKVNVAKEQKQGNQVKETEQKPITPDLSQRKQKNRALIDQIIDNNPGLIKIKEEQKFYVPDTKAKESLLENEHLVTETLAKIYALQGNTGKAIRAYEILSLKFPQKSVYFAGLIQKLKNNQ
jgi:hypothetical protein